MFTTEDIEPYIDDERGWIIILATSAVLKLSMESGKPFFDVVDAIFKKGSPEQVPDMIRIMGILAKVGNDKAAQETIIRASEQIEQALTALEGDQNAETAITDYPEDFAW